MSFSIREFENSRRMPLEPVEAAIPATSPVNLHELPLTTPIDLAPESSEPSEPSVNHIDVPVAAPLCEPVTQVHDEIRTPGLASEQSTRRRFIKSSLGLLGVALVSTEVGMTAGHYGRRQLHDVLPGNTHGKTTRFDRVKDAYVNGTLRDHEQFIKNVFSQTDSKIKGDN